MFGKMADYAGLCSNSGRRQFRQSARGPLRRIVSRRLDRIAESNPGFDPTDHDEDERRQFARECLQDLRSDRRYGSFGIMVLMWVLQATVIHFVMEWWKRRQQDQRTPMSGGLS